MKPALKSGKIVGGSQLGSMALGALLMLGLSEKLTWADDGAKIIVLSVVAGVSYIVTYFGLADEKTETGIEFFDKGTP